LIIQLTAAASLAAWVYLFTSRGNFWQIAVPPKPARTPEPKFVCVVVPARDEEGVIPRSLSSLLNQNYPGRIHVILVDDHSADRTAAIARGSAGPYQLTVIQAGPLPDGWSGKLWAISEGLKQAAVFAPDYLLLTDADIVHSPNNIAELVTRAEATHLDLVSLMVQLRCRSFAETLLIPAFVFFFFMLYPPAWVAQRNRKTAAAAGGCILIRPAALNRIGGIESIRAEIIDDCALARAVKRTGGAIWLGVTKDTSSIREYNTFAEIRGMIARTAFAQLHHSTLLLLLTILGMAIIYLAPPLLLFTGKLLLVYLAFAAWSLMIVSYASALRFYGRSVAWAPLLPLVALFYMSATVDSARSYWTGRGGIWKGRVQDAK
jgi:hopene-associated glycosyltransferase HpnB